MAVLLGCAMQASLNHGSTLKEYDTDSEVFRQQFRQFPYQQAAGPREAFNKLRELCRQWLQPAMRSKEEILELLVLEQLLTILPPEIETWVRLHRPENTGKLLTLIEDLQRELRTPEQQVGRQEMLLEELTPEETAHIPPPGIQQKSPELRVLGPSRVATMTEEWIPHAEPWYLTCTAAGECSTYSEIVSDTDEENEENISEREYLDNKYPYIITSEDSALHAPVLHTDCKELENERESVPYVPKPVGDQNLPVAEKPKRPNLEEPVTSRPYKRKSAAEKPHRCSQCGTCFARKSQLTGHQRIHSGAECYKCPECGKSFLRRSDFTRHRRLHTGERPFMCTICQKQFSRRAHVTVHQKVHFRGETYKCLECGKTFQHPFSFKRHLRGHKV